LIVRRSVNAGERRERRQYAARGDGGLPTVTAGAGACDGDQRENMAEIRAEIAANVWQVVAEEGQMVAEGDEIVILESMKMEIPVVTEIPGVVRELHVEPEQVVQEGDLIAIIDES